MLAIRSERNLKKAMRALEDARDLVETAGDHLRMAGLDGSAEMAFCSNSDDALHTLARCLGNRIDKISVDGSSNEEAPF